MLRPGHGAEGPVYGSRHGYLIPPRNRVPCTTLERTNSTPTSQPPKRPTVSEPARSRDAENVWRLPHGPPRPPTRAHDADVCAAAATRTSALSRILPLPFPARPTPSLQLWPTERLWSLQHKPALPAAQVIGGLCCTPTDFSRFISALQRGLPRRSGIWGVPGLDRWPVFSWCGQSVSTESPGQSPHCDPKRPAWRRFSLRWPAPQFG